jgi:hypothetical protein
VTTLGVNTGTPPTGYLYASSDITAYYSDKRLKDIHGPISDPLQKLSKINGVYYTYNDLARSYGFDDTSRRIGFLAQEIQEVLPETIKPAPFDSNKFGHTISGNKYITVDYSKVIPLLIEALKEQKKQIDELSSML